MEEKIRHLLASLVHPETGQDIVSSGFIEHIASAAGKITVVLRFAKARDPFAVKIKNQAESLLREAFPGAEVLVVGVGRSVIRAGPSPVRMPLGPVEDAQPTSRTSSSAPPTTARTAVIDARRAPMTIEPTPHRRSRGHAWVTDSGPGWARRWWRPCASCGGFEAQALHAFAPQPPSGG